MLGQLLGTLEVCVKLVVFMFARTKQIFMVNNSLLVDLISSDLGQHSRRLVQLTRTTCILIEFVPNNLKFS